MQFNYKKIKINFLEEAYQKIATGCYNLGDFLFPKILLSRLFVFVNSQKESIEKNYCLGFCYEHGEVTGAIKDINKAIKLYDLCCNQDHALSAFQLGYIFFFNKEVKNMEKANYYWKKCLSLGYILPNLYIAKKNFDEQKYNDLINLLMPLVEMSCSDAQTFLGDIYSKGIGVEKNPLEAFKHYRDAAISGDAKAQFTVGTFFENGIVCKKDNNMAFKYYLLSAQQGNKEAEIKVGYFYDKGIGTVKSDFDAFKWYSNALQTQNSKAMLYIGQFYNYGRYVKKNLTKGFQMIYDAATKYKDSEAQCYLGKCFKQGLNVGIDATEAVQWFGLAAKNGNIEAQYCLANCYELGDGTEVNLKKAFSWYKISADAGNPDSEYKIGMFYLEGKGVMPDRNLAAQYLELARRHGNTLAKMAIDKNRLRS